MSVCRKTRTGAAILVMVLSFAGCSVGEDEGRTAEGGAERNGERVTDAAPPGSLSPAIDPDSARKMSIAQILRKDARFSRFRDLAAGTSAMFGRTTWLKIWDMAATNMGANWDGVTVFVPVDEAFELLEPDVLRAIEEERLDNDARYTLLGVHYVHRLYPSSEFEPGPQSTWSGSQEVELTLEPLTWGGCPILDTDIRANNGYIHAIGCVVVPDEVRKKAKAG